MSRFYVPKENVKGKNIVIDGKEAHHILDVMRLKDGDTVVVFDGTGNEYSGFIKDIDARARRLNVEIVRTEKPPRDSMPEVTLAQAIPKKGKMAYIVEKATELGVSNVIPFISERTVVKPDRAGRKKKTERWQKIAVEAAKQCGRTGIPVVGDVVEFEDLAKRINEYDLSLLACLSGETVPLKDTLAGFKAGKILVLIGPEGDFTPEEAKMADRDNCRFVSLGRRVLKSDTAGLFVLSALNYEFTL